VLDILKRQKQREAPKTNRFSVSIVELCSSPRIRRANVESETVNSGHLGAVDVLGPLLRRLATRQAYLEIRNVISCCPERHLEEVVTRSLLPCSEQTLYGLNPPLPACVRWFPRGAPLCLFGTLGNLRRPEVSTCTLCLIWTARGSFDTQKSLTLEERKSRWLFRQETTDQAQNHVQHFYCRDNRDVANSWRAGLKSCQKVLFGNSGSHGSKKASKQLVPNLIHSRVLGFSPLTESSVQWPGPCNGIERGLKGLYLHPW